MKRTMIENGKIIYFMWCDISLWGDSTKWFASYISCLLNGNIIKGYKILMSTEGSLGFHPLCEVRFRNLVQMSVEFSRLSISQNDGKLKGIFPNLFPRELKTKTSIWKYYKHMWIRHVQLMPRFLEAHDCSKRVRSRLTQVSMC